MATPQRPNILFIQPDSMDGRAMGHPALQGATPHLDGLAAHGVLFRNAYCNNPICVPSRASMFSGLYTHHCEGWNNYKGLSPSDPTLLDGLAQAGYRLKVVGKTDYLSGEHTIRARVSPWTRSANIWRPNYRMGAPQVLDAGQRVHQRDWDLVDTAVAWLAEEGDGETPFFLYLGIGAPHPEFRTSPHYLGRIDLAKVDLPVPDPSDHPVLAYQRMNKNWLHGFDEETVRLVRRIYFAMIAEVDDMVGRLLRALEEAGLADSTIVVFTSDHGELAMEHGQFYKMSPYEPSARVPLIVRGPGIRAGLRVDLPVSLVDVYPTLVDLAHLDRPPRLDGHSLLPMLGGVAGEHPGWVLTEFHDTTCNTGVFMLREGDWKYIVYVGAPCQLFNLADDPAEVQDLAQARPDMVAQLDRKLRSIVDYEAVDARVKAYDRDSFRRWREGHRAAGDYQELMTRVFSGWDGLAEGEGDPWTAADESLIDAWLEGKGDG